MSVINLVNKFAQIDEYWSPKIIGELNGQTVKIAKIKGDFIWHHHVDEDEFFLVVHGQMTIKLPEEDITLREGEFFIVPRGVEHKPMAADEAHILLFEPSGTLNTGNIRDEHTVEEVDRI